MSAVTVPERVDVCVVGGGVIGLAVAFELAERGRRVAVLEAGEAGHRAAAWVAAGMIAPVSEADIAHPELTRLALESHRLYPGWVERIEAVTGLNTGFDQAGTLWVAVHRDHSGRLEHLRAFQVERGLNTVRLSATDVREREPLLAPNASGGLLARDDWQVNPRRLLHALAAAVTAHQGVVVESAPVTDIERHGSGWRVSASIEGDHATSVEAAQVVLAPGARGGALLERWLPGAGMRAVKGQVLRLRAPEGEPIAHHVIRTPEVYLVPRADGEVVVGATMEEMGFDERVTVWAVHDLLREARRVLPGIAELDFVEGRAGFRPALRDHLPAIGAVEEGLFVATGHFRSGIELAPATGRLIADLVVDGHTDDLVQPFDPGRFAAAAVGKQAPA